MWTRGFRCFFSNDSPKQSSREVHWDYFKYGYPVSFCIDCSHCLCKQLISAVCLNGSNCLLERDVKHFYPHFLRNNNHKQMEMVWYFRHRFVEDKPGKYFSLKVCWFTYIAYCVSADNIFSEKKEFWKIFLTYFEDLMQERLQPVLKEKLWNWWLPIPFFIFCFALRFVLIKLFHSC